MTCKYNSCYTVLIVRLVNFLYFNEVLQRHENSDMKLNDPSLVS